MSSPVIADAGIDGHARGLPTPAARHRRQSHGPPAKFAAAGKSAGKKDLGAIARGYGNVYVAQIAMGANDTQATKAFVEAAAWPGPSLVIAYSTRIAHGIDMSKSMTHQKDAVRSGYWPLYRFSPSDAEHGTPFHLEFVATEARYAVLARTHPERAAELGALLQADAPSAGATTPNSPPSSAPSSTARPSVDRHLAHRSIATVAHRSIATSPISKRSGRPSTFPSSPA